MNIIQFWVIDTIVKHKSGKKQHIHLSPDEDDAQVLLVTDDEENDDREDRPFTGDSSELVDHHEPSTPNANDPTLVAKNDGQANNHNNQRSFEDFQDQDQFQGFPLTASRSDNSLHELNTNIRRQSP